ncbi:hypothetical protein SYJ56_04835 [Algoriphagus sp. D3-2-R+10]|uniref:hypothetical protein n=1 Tax=Algoriphagus aurantiacus TaxID=3103948 RepID=UPI002B36970F|nr:hypothetical protein [Algoriphagus sp. D3-2-R+10]MEB2774619.1 hypothetical protein [Algoriphagus sp. D3-2-R+10]
MKLKATMNKTAIENGEKYFFKLPFEPGTFKLTDKTLNQHSEFSRFHHHYFRIKVRKISFRNEILTLGVKILEEAEERIFIKVTEKELWVRCSVDTDRTYLSRYAYFALIKIMFLNYYNFERFYWPDFFDQSTGKSKFLDIINDRQGLDITLKSKYPHFYKPGDVLLKLSEQKTKVKIRETPTVLDEIPQTDHAIGYFLVDTNLNSSHSNHFPFLVPYYGKLTKGKEAIKSYTSFLTDEADTQFLTFTPNQELLNEVCFKMKKIAPLEPTYCRIKEHVGIEEEKKGRLLFDLWHESLKLIISQRYFSYHFIYGMLYLKGKPRKSNVYGCRISQETPQLFFRKIDKKTHYQFELRFKILGKAYIPNESHTEFFINYNKDPWTFHLLGSFQDYQVTSFFAKFKFKLGVLKAHYKDDLKDFADGLGRHYEIKEF